MLRQSLGSGLLITEPFICMQCRVCNPSLRRHFRLKPPSIRSHTAASTASAEAYHDHTAAGTTPLSDHLRSKASADIPKKIATGKKTVGNHGHKSQPVAVSDTAILDQHTSKPASKLISKVRSHSRRVRRKIRSPTKARHIKLNTHSHLVREENPPNVDIKTTGGPTALAQDELNNSKKDSQLESQRRTSAEGAGTLEPEPSKSRNAANRSHVSQAGHAEAVVEGNLLAPQTSTNNKTVKPKVAKNEVEEPAKRQRGPNGVKKVVNIAAGATAQRSRNKLPGKSDNLREYKSLDDILKQVLKTKTTSENKVRKLTPKSTEKKKAITVANVQSLDANSLNFEALELEKASVPSLSYGLHRALFNPGVYVMQDPDSRVYNFDPYLQKPMALEDFNFNAITPYITSSKDDTLISSAIRLGKKYVGSTSSMTSTLGQFHFLLSQWREINTKMLSQDFPAKFRSFTKISRAPTSVFLRWKDGAYAIDADKQYDSTNVLSMLGKSLEKLLTLEKSEYERYRIQSSNAIMQEEGHKPESYNYSTCGDLLMRSQLDAYDKRLPGTGLFDLKTRACIAIRMDVKNFKIGMDYEIKHEQGEWESFEREYYDMIRATMLKYSLQVRMGRMEGIFVAFHNIARIFGFQYISLKDMDYAIHGETSTFLGDQEFKISLKLLNEVLDRASKKYPEQSLRLHFETRETSTPFMYIFAEPMADEEIDAIQDTNAEENAEFERNILGIGKNSGEIDTAWAKYQSEVDKAVAKDAAAFESPDSDDQVGPPKEEMASDGVQHFQGEIAIEIEDGALADIHLETAEVKDNDDGTSGVRTVQVEATSDEIGGENDTADREQLATETDLQHDNTEFNQEAESLSTVDKIDARDEISSAEPTGADEESLEDLAKQPSEFMDFNDSTTESGDSIFLDQIISAQDTENGEEQDQRDVLALILTVRNNVNGQSVQRPQNLLPSDAWTVEYSFAQIESKTRARKLYDACMRRRESVFQTEAETGIDGEAEGDYFLKLIRLQTAKGKAWRTERDEMDKGKPIQMWDGSTVETEST